MRFNELLTERRALNITDKERGQLLFFIVKWLQGSFMRSKPTTDHMPTWQRIHDLFPPNLSRPVRLMRLVTLPIEYADLKGFYLEKPAPLSVGSWTSAHIGLESVHGVASEIKSGRKTCRIAIQAMIQPNDVLASYQSLKKAFLSLSYDYDYDRHTDKERSYLGITDDAFLDDIGYYQALYREQSGGPLRQYEYIVKTTPVEAKNIRVYRKGNDTFFMGHDDPNDYGTSRAWFKD